MTRCSACRKASVSWVHLWQCRNREKFIGHINHLDSLDLHQYKSNTVTVVQQQQQPQQQQLESFGCVLGDGFGWFPVLSCPVRDKATNEALALLNYQTSLTFRCDLSTWKSFGMIDCPFKEVLCSLNKGTPLTWKHPPAPKALKQKSFSWHPACLSVIHAQTSLFQALCKVSSEKMEHARIARTPIFPYPSPISTHTCPDCSKAGQINTPFARGLECPWILMVHNTAYLQEMHLLSHQCEVYGKLLEQKSGTEGTIRN